MTILDCSAELDTAVGPLVPDEAQLAAVAFLARYGGRTLDAYRHDLRNLFRWAADHGLPVLEAPAPISRCIGRRWRNAVWPPRRSTGMTRVGRWIVERPAI